VKTGATTRRYLGTFYTTSTTQTEDSAAKRFLWNAANRVTRVVRIVDATASWAGTAALRQANGSTANQIDLVQGLAEEAIDLTLVTQGSNNTIGVQLTSALGEDSAAAIAAESIGNYAQVAVAATSMQIIAKLTKVPAVGRHFYAWLENNSGGTQTWIGTTAPQKSGISGTIRN
jgi:hypothetical protein